MTDLTKQAQIAREIREALKDGGEMSSSELNNWCSSALDSTDICRVIYDMRNTGLLAVADERVVNGKGKPVKFYRWIGPTDAEPEFSKKRKTNPAKSIDDETVSTHPPVSIIAVTPEEEQSMDEAQHKAPAPSPTEPKREPFRIDRADPTELALADLLDQADEALLALADSLLSDHPVWSRLRQLASDAHGMLCDYRLMRTLEQQP
jgi:predicted transcriptional regulator